MNKKVIFSLIITTFLMGAMIPLNTQAIDHGLTWHSSLDDNKVAWRIYEQYLFDPAEPPKLGGKDLYKGSVMAFEFNDTLPSYYGELYEAPHPPGFFKLIVDYQEVSLYDIDFLTEPGFAIQFLIIPYLFDNAASGLTENITEFLNYRTTTNPNITGFDYFISGGNYVTVDIYNDYFSSFQLTYNNDTGICANFYIEDDFGEMWGQLDIWESEIDDEGTDTTTSTLNFHPNIGVGTKLSWKYTEITYDPLAGGAMEINNVTLAVGHVFSFIYDVIPTNPAGYYGSNPTDPNSFFDVYFEMDPMDMEHMSRAQSVLWLTLINPLTVSVYNGTILPMEAIHEIRDFNDPGIENTTISTVGDTMTLQFDFEEENDLWAVDLDININSGIVEHLAIDIIGFVHFEMEYATENSTLEIDGTIYTPIPSNTWSLSGFNWFYLVFSIFVVLPIIRKRKK
jgi:hypothetical protein